MQSAHQGKSDEYELNMTETLMGRKCRDSRSRWGDSLARGKGRYYHVKMHEHEAGRHTGTVSVPA